MAWYQTYQLLLQYIAFAGAACGSVGLFLIWLSRTDFAAIRRIPPPLRCVFALAFIFAAFASQKQSVRDSLFSASSSSSSSASLSSTTQDNEPDSVTEEDAEGETNDEPVALDPPAAESNTNCLHIARYAPPPVNELDIAWPNPGYHAEDIRLYGTWNLRTNYVAVVPRTISYFPDLSGATFGIDWPSAFSNAVSRGVFPQDATLNQGFFTAAWYNVDTDNDGIPDADEIFIHRTDPDNPDTDGDWISDADELLIYGTDPVNADTDGDGLHDGIDEAGSLDPDCDGMTTYDEVMIYHTNPFKLDTDEDGVNDDEEIRLSMNPCSSDSDEDGMDDAWELQHGFSPVSSSDANTDADGDGLTNLEEYEIGTDPNLADSDGDGLNDYEERNYQTNPLSIDTDGDGLGDRAEILQGISPLMRDTDQDGISDPEELARGLSPVLADTDGDYLMDEEEASFNTNPLLFDTDGDGLSDGEEIVYHKTNPLSADTDADGIPDGEEIDLGTDPLNFDTDGDGCADLADCAEGRHPLNAEISSTWSDDEDVYYDCVGNYTVNVTYKNPNMRTAQDGINRVYGLLASGTTTTNDLSCAINCGDASSAFSMTAEGVSFIPRETGLYLFEIQSDDSASIRVGSGICATSHWERVARYVNEPGEGVLFAGQEYPISVTWENAGGPADLCFPSFGRFKAIPRAVLSMNCSSKFVQAYPYANVPNELGVMRYPKDDELVAISVMVSGGYFGAQATFRKEGFGLLTKVCGDEFPEHVAVAAGQGRRFRGVYRADSISGAIDDVSLFVDLVENETGLAQSDQISLTVTKLGIAADFDREGGVGDDDRAAARHGKMLRHWVNDDDDEGDTVVMGELSDSDEPGVFFPDCGNGTVDGKRDLLDFVPVELDIYEMIDLSRAHDLGWKFYLSDTHQRTKIVWTSMSAVSRDYVRTDLEQCGANLGQSAGVAATEALTSDGVELPVEFVAKIRQSQGKGVVLVEAKDCGSGQLVLQCKNRNGEVIAESRLNYNMSSVNDMYSFASLRNMNERSTVEEPPNNPIDPLAKNVFFLHGYSFNESEARAWSSEMFKRLWQSGARMNFCGITWKGNEGFFTPLFYHKNVENALKSGSLLKDYIERHYPFRTNVVIAHSLGNMVVCEALREGLRLDKYFMCNAAIPSEAFSAEKQNISPSNHSFVPKDWREYPTECWSARYHELFEEWDDRSRLTWANYFQDIHLRAAIYNYYSAEDEIFAIQGEAPDPLDGKTIRYYAWQKQEVSKGAGSFIGTDEAGWGFYSRFYGTFYSKEQAEESRVLGRLDQTGYVVFRHNPSMMFNPQISKEDRRHLLAHAIPALSVSVGICDDSCMGEPVGMHGNKAGWVDRGPDYGSNWLHSDIKDVAYRYNHKIFDTMKADGGL